MAWSLSVDAVNAPLVESKVKQVGPSPDWKSGASDVLAYRDEGRQPTFVLELVLEGQAFWAT